VADYIKTFEWQDVKYPRARSLVEITGMITERMRSIDGDLKKLMDELTETKNNLNALSKGKETLSYYTMDLGEIIYNTDKVRPDVYFVEKHGS